ncbi:MAG: transposase [Nanoarchaeota archaeon]|nr:transposase [Nanoarchaeota archaeon]MCG2717758.1 transposase [Nanoarchaeota archaeon]
MQLAQQIKIKPTKKQEKILLELSEKCRLLYNFALQERRKSFEQNKKHIFYLKQQNDLPKIKNKFPEYRWVYSKVLQYTLRILDADYKSFFALWKKGDKKARLPKFKGKKYFTTMVFNQSGFKHKKGFIELSHKYPSNIKLLFKIPEKFYFKKIYQIMIYKKDGEYHLSVIYEKQEKGYRDNKLYQAFDLGATKHTAINNKGRCINFKNERPDKHWEKTITEIQSRRDHCKKESRKWNKLHKILAKCKRKSTNQLKDFQHKLSRKIIDNTKANTIVVGKLETKKLSQKNKYAKGLNKSLYNTGNISRFVRFLTYKAKLIGKRVIEINERYTTKKCCCCGNEKEMPLYKRIYKCDCGNVIDRDENSAINILLRYLSTNGLWTAYQQFIGNLRQTGLTIKVRHSQEAITSKLRF